MPITSNTHDVFTQQRIEFQQRIIKSGHWVCCLNCDNWMKIQGRKIEEEKCGLFNLVPPAHIIVNGCKDHIDDIPF